jgi:hypothetical protein
MPATAVLGNNPHHSPHLQHTQQHPIPRFMPLFPLQLQQGAAEVFGTELQLGERINISGKCLAVFTWEGATVAVEGDPAVM